MTQNKVRNNIPKKPFIFETIIKSLVIGFSAMFHRLVKYSCNNKLESYEQLLLESVRESVNIRYSKNVFMKWFMNMNARTVVLLMANDNAYNILFKDIHKKFNERLSIEKVYPYDIANSSNVHIHKELCTLKKDLRAFIREKRKVKK